LAHARQSSSPEAAHGVALQPVVLKGKVVSEEGGEPLVGATVTIKNAGIKALTDANGGFIINGYKPEGILVVSYVGYGIKEIPFDSKDTKTLTIQLIPNDNVLDEAVVIGYGQTTRRLNTGSVSKVTAEDIAKQPVGNPLAALQGRVPGMVVTQTSGVPGAAINVQIRGQSVLDLARSTNDPLFIIDGVPFAQGNENLNQLSSAANNPRATAEGGLSPLNMINPADIESIEILKDADATAIYGSRGANGVILITTKKGKEGNLRFTLNSYMGISRAPATMEMLSTAEYLQMRKEALTNDGDEPNVNNAPDLFLWDTTRYTDWRKSLIGGTASTHDLQGTVTGGNEYTRFSLGTSYRYENTVFPGDMANKRGAAHLSLNHRSANDKLTLALTANYSNSTNNLATRDLTMFLNLPPHFPNLEDARGGLVFGENGLSFNVVGAANPLSYTRQHYKAESESFVNNLLLGYKLLPYVSVRLSAGYNTLKGSETSLQPSTSLDPASNQLPFADFGNSATTSWIMEPQIEFLKDGVIHGKLNVLLGGTWQASNRRSTMLNATGYTNDLLLSSINAAGAVRATNSYNEYRYQAFFGRINYNVDDKYIVNITGRRDGSSRFGTNNRFANFGALGLAWLFSREQLISDNLSFLSFGKLRFSYGITGNDQIGNYLYLDTWQSTAQPYQGIPGLRPSRLFNGDFQWEVNRKMEVALELGFFEDLLLLNTNFYRNRSSNQLISYNLPNTTGFLNITRNLPAKVENRGLEFVLSNRSLELGHLKWTGSLNATFPKNTLLKFPGIEESSYANRYEEGQSLNVIKRLEFLGVDPETGLYRFTDVNGDGVLNSRDYQVLGSTDPKFYGGFQNTFTYQRFDLSLFFEFRKQLGQNYYVTQSSYQPGFFYNQPVLARDRWKQPGDDAAIQKLTGRRGGAAGQAISNLGLSNAVYSDASFIRLRNVSLAYNLPPVIAEKMKLQQCRIYFQGQNLFVWSNYIGSDPETQNMYMLPPLRTFTMGIQLTI
jgi:TonB-linked SusC/RagA family outer membrane protein